MTSPVDTSVKFFHSMMANPPVLSGTAGSGIALLDACLKDGFDTKSLVSLVVSGGVATATWSGVHSALPATVIQIAGVTGALTALNGEQKVVSKPNATSCTFATAAADGVATGTITMKMAPLGWAKPLSGTNLAAYQSQSALSPKHLLRVDDTNTIVMRLVGYESMSDINTGLGMFPTAAQVSGGGMWPKRSLTSSTGVPWVLVGDDRMFYFIVSPYSPNPTAWTFNSTVRGFGDPIPYKPSGDAYATVLNVSNQGNTVNSGADGDFTYPNVSLTYSPRSHTGLGSSVGGYCSAYTGGGNPSGTFATLGAFPSIVDGALYMSKKYIALAGESTPRSEAPGLRHVPQAASLSQFAVGDLWPGAGPDAGKSMLAVRGTSTALSTGVSDGSSGVAFFDVTGPWR